LFASAQRNGKQQPVTGGLWQTGLPRAGAICYLGYCRLGLTGKELARYFAMSRPSVSQAIQRGEQFAKQNIKFG
jgi:hypothetical protein